VIINRLPSAKFHLASPNSHWRSRSGELGAPSLLALTPKRATRASPGGFKPGRQSSGSTLRNLSPAFEILKKMALKKSAAGKRAANKFEAVRTAKEAARR
jgi:hypothetical protein